MFVKRVILVIIYVYIPAKKINVGVPCPLIPYIDNSQNNHTRQYRFPDSVTIICNIGYKVNGSKSLECNSDGQWHKPYPVCIGWYTSRVRNIIEIFTSFLYVIDDRFVRNKLLAQWINFLSIPNKLW